MQKIIHTIKLSPAVIIPSTLLFLTLTSALVLLSSNSNADTTSATASVTVPDTCYMSSTSATHTGTASGGTYTENFGGESTVTVTCNDRNGYSVYAVGYSNDVEGTNGLIGTSTGLVIPSGTSTSTNVSNWAMKLTPGTGTFAPTILSDTNGSFANYHVVPTTTTKVATLTSDINVSNSSQFKTSYAVAVSLTQPADTYVGKVKYTVVHPNYSNADGTLESYPITLGFGANTSSIIIDGVTYTSTSATPNLTYGTHAVSGTYPSGYEFSSWSATGNIAITDFTSASTTVNVTGAGALTITGQKQVVTFAQAYATAGKSQTSGYYTMQDMTNTICSSVSDGQTTTLRDIRANGINYTVAKIGSNCWMTKNLDLPGGTTLSSTDTNVPNNYSTTTTGFINGDTLPASSLSGFSSNTTAYVYNSGSTICTSSSPCYSYYSWRAATAGYNTTSDGSSVDYDICPKGWRLPTKTDANALRAIYNTGSKLMAAPFLGVNSGSCWYGATHSTGPEGDGLYWLSVSSSDTRAYFFDHWSRSNNDSSGIYSDNKLVGTAIRCVAK